MDIANLVNTALSSRTIEYAVNLDICDRLKDAPQHVPMVLGMVEGALALPYGFLVLFCPGMRVN